MTEPGSAARQRLDAVIAFCKERGMWADLQALTVRALAEGKPVEQVQVEWEAEDDEADRGRGTS